MNKKFVLIPIIIIFLGIGGYLILHATSKQTLSKINTSQKEISPPTNQSINTSVASSAASTSSSGSSTSLGNENLPSSENKSTPSDWKTYINEKYGFTFQYPKDWIYSGKDVEAAGSSGQLVSVEGDFSDSTSQTTFSFVYHLAPWGAELFDYSTSQFDSSQGWYVKGGMRISVAGTKGIEAFTTIQTDGRGHSLNPPIRLILLDFLDNQHTGEIELQLHAPLNRDNIEVANFNIVVSTFKFIK